MVMTLTDTFPTTPGMNPKESANKLWHTLSWLHSTKKKDYLSPTFLPSMKPKWSSASWQGISLGSQKWQFLPYEFAVAHPEFHAELSWETTPLCIQCSPFSATVQDRKKRKMLAQQMPLCTQKAISNGSPVCTWIKRGKWLDHLHLHTLTKLFSQWSWKKSSKNCVDSSGEVNLLGESKLCFLHILLTEFKLNTT